MQLLFQLIVLLAVIAGTLFSIIGVMGMIRLPDVYTRLHAVGKVSVFGVVLLLVAAKTLGAVDLGKSILLVVFLVIAGPTLTHSLAAAAYRMGIPIQRAVRNDLAVKFPPVAPPEVLRLLENGAGSDDGDETRLDRESPVREDDEDQIEEHRRDG